MPKLRAYASLALVCASVFAPASARAEVVRLLCDNDPADVHDTIDVDLAAKTVLKVYANGHSEEYEITQINARFIVWRGEWSRYHTDPPQLTGVEYRLDRASGFISWQYINPDGASRSQRVNPYPGPCRRAGGNVL